jgi:uncharacterized protein with HEPN domain
MREDDRVRLRHMLDAAREARGFVADRKRQDLDTDRMLVLALVKCVEIIGMRNRLVHAYFDVNLDVVWTTVRHALPPLVTALQGALHERGTD